MAVNKDIPTTGELSNEQLLVEAAQIRAAKRIKFDNNNVDEDELETTVTNAEAINSLKNIKYTDYFLGCNYNYFLFS